jgi:hypothetical protein
MPQSLHNGYPSSANGPTDDSVVTCESSNSCRQGGTTLGDGTNDLANASLAAVGQPISGGWSRLSLLAYQLTRAEGGIPNLVIRLGTSHLIFCLGLPIGQCSGPQSRTDDGPVTKHPIALRARASMIRQPGIHSCTSAEASWQRGWFLILTEQPIGEKGGMCAVRRIKFP